MAGHYQYKVMPYGLACVPSVFSCLIYHVLRDFLGKCTIAYTDDILIYSHTEDVHVSHVRKVFERLWQNKLYIKREKCKFHVTRITFLEYIINTTGISTDLDKLNAIRDWPTPHTIKELQCFLEFFSHILSHI